MLRIRLRRGGRRNHPFFQIVVIKKESPPRGGEAVEIVGHLNPRTKEKEIEEERVKYWLSVGARPSDTVYNLLVEKGVVEGEKRPVHNRPEEEREKEVKEEKAEEEEADEEEEVDEEEGSDEEEVEEEKEVEGGPDQKRGKEKES